MRIISGKYRGKKLLFPEGEATRPTKDRIRESVFNVLRHAPWCDGFLDEALVLDGFAGTGAFGLEALSQGAKHCVFIEHNKEALRCCAANIRAMHGEEVSLLLSKDIFTLGERPPAVAPRTLLFLDPPYGHDLGAQALLYLQENHWLAKDAVIILEMAKASPERIPAGFHVMDERSYGIASIVFVKGQPA